MAGRCQRCGQRARKRYCRECRVEQAHGDLEDRGDRPDQRVEPLRFRCTQCGEHYRTAGSRACPECGSYRRRYAGDEDGSGDSPPVRADGGTQTAAACPHLRTRRYGRTDQTGTPVVEVRCVRCGKTISEGSHR